MQYPSCFLSVLDTLEKGRLEYTLPGKEHNKAYLHYKLLLGIQNNGENPWHSHLLSIRRHLRILPVFFITMCNCTAHQCERADTLYHSYMCVCVRARTCKCVCRCLLARAFLWLSIWIQFDVPCFFLCQTCAIRVQGINHNNDWPVSHAWTAPDKKLGWRKRTWSC